MDKATGSFIEHLDEMRRRLWAAVAAFLISSAVSLFISDKLLEMTLAPLRRQIGTLYFFSPADAFIVRIKVALLSGFLIASPVIFGQLWLFIAPALHKNEKRLFIPLVFFATALFLSGAAFAFFQVAPVAMRFLMGMQTEWLKPLLSASDYLSFLAAMMLAFGFAFNLPVVVLVLSFTGILNARLLRQFHRQAVVLIFIAAAVLTPGPDIAGQLLLAAPLLLLFELSLLLVSAAEAFRRKNAGTVSS